MHTIEFSKVFVDGSLLEGIVYQDKLTNATSHDVARYIELQESGDVVRTGAYGGSDYQIKNVVVRCA